MKVIIINGPMGVGKTAVGKCIAGRIPGTAFIDGDWCMDIHPFVGSRETRAMAADNILHMIRNYQSCSACRMVVLVWLMDDPRIRDILADGIAAMQADLYDVTLICDRDSLITRWKNDHDCEWRTDRWLEISLASLPVFASMDHTIDTGELSVECVAEKVLGMAGETGAGFQPAAGKEA